MSLPTPGPWTDDSARHDDPYQELRILGPSGYCICTLWMDDAPVDEWNRVQRANAALIKASPDLLAAMERMVAVCEALMPGVRFIAVKDYGELNDAPIAARKAMAKARGLV